MFGSNSKSKKTLLGGSDKRKKKFRWKRFIIQFAVLLTFFAAIALVGSWIGYRIVTDPYKSWAEEFDLSQINQLEHPSIIYDRNGLEMGRFYVQNRSYVTIDQIPSTVVDTLIAQEDARFLDHQGVDFVGIGRAAYLNWKSKSADSGASTITQQLARNAYDLKKRADERGESPIGRKLVEAFLAHRIEQKYSKNEILEFYLNRVYLGSGFYGIRSAALGYFGKEPIDLTTREAASIAALIKSPNDFSPLKNPEGNLKWRNDVLDRMVRRNMLQPAAAEKIKKMPLGLNPKPLRRGVSHFYERLSRHVEQIVGEEEISSGGFRIYTTLDLKVQQQAEQSLRQQLLAIENRNDYSHQKLADYNAPALPEALSDEDGEIPANHDESQQSAPNYLEGSVLMVDNRTGGILAYVGGRDFLKRQFDTIHASRPPGTAYLPVVYASAFENDLSPITKLTDEAIDNRLVGVGGMEGILAEWGPESFENKYEGQITARYALTFSKIAASIRLGKELGFEKVLSTHRRLKLPPLQPDQSGNYLPRSFVGFDEASLADLVKAYGAFGNDGLVNSEFFFLDNITDSSGNLIYTHQTATIENTERVLSPATSYQVQDVLRQALTEGTGKADAPSLNPALNAYGKTGTNHRFSDLWFLGGNSKVTCGVWIGFLEGMENIYRGAFSSTHAQPIWTAALNALPAEFHTPQPSPPNSLKGTRICRISGQQGTRYCYEPAPADAPDAGRLRPSTYTEYLRNEQLQNIGFCSHHGPAGSWETDIRIVAPKGTSERGRILPLPAVRIQGPVLIGTDPYRSDALVNTPRSPDFYSQVEARASRPIIVGLPNEIGDEDARIRLPKPRPSRFDLEID